jgi:hypothetical protein
MGYTHYWRSYAEATDAQWRAIENDFRRLLRHSPVKVAENSEDYDPPVVDSECICFNGVGSDGHETMVFTPTPQGFNFCKTARKPYDLLVTALLILADHHAPGVWTITSDGDAADWQPALDWMNDLGPEVYKLPAGLRGPTRHTLRLVIDVTIETADLDDVQEVRNNLLDVPTMLMRNGMITDGTDATVVVITPRLEEP